MTGQRQFFPGVHALRALAATLVVIEHAGATANDYSVLGQSIIIPHFSYGVIGVVLFFAISGFVIALQRSKPVGEFVVHRLLRIYPSYWLAMILAAIALASVRQHVSASASSILLYPTDVGDASLAIPYWTLVFEMLFYALAAIAFAARLSDRALTIIAELWIVAVNLAAVEPTIAKYTLPGFPSILWSPAVQVFPMGLICGIHFDKFRLAGRWPYAVGAVASFVASFPFAAFSTYQLLALGLSASCVVVATADLDITSRVVKKLGDASYGIYLVHFPAMVVASMLSPGRGLLWFLAIGVSVGTLFGLLDHRLYRWMVSTSLHIKALHTSHTSR